MKKTETDNKCPNCGSQLQYDSETKNLKCISCRSLFDIESFGSGDLDEEEQDYYKMLSELKEKQLTKKVVSSLSCKNCGASLRHDDNTTSTTCPFCGSNYVIETNLEEEVIPISGIIPFSVSKEECNLQFHNWIKHKFFVPSRFKKSQFALDIHPVYLPFWTFDMNCYTKYRAKRGDHEYIIVRKKDAEGREVIDRKRVTHWSYRWGVCNNNFDDIMVLGSKDQKNRYYINKACNFNFNEMEKFNSDFLVGYSSEKISLSLEDGFNRAREIIAPQIEKTIEYDVGGDEVRILSYHTKYEDITFKQILVPMYNGIYDYNGRKYAFVMNGQTSKFAGGCPISWVKVMAFVFIIVLIVAIVAILFI